MKDSFLDESGDRGFPKPVEELLEKLGLELEDMATVGAALTHPSYWGEYAISESKRLARSYERLEFLGDSALALSMCNFLFQRYPDYHQGKLSKLKSHLVSKEVLQRIAEKLDVGEYIRVGKGVILGSGGRNHANFKVDCLEALIGAAFVEKGFEYAAEFVMRLFEEEIEQTADVDALPDYKTALQEMAQKRFRSLPVYKLSSQSGPEHRKMFTIKVFVNGEAMGEGEGSSKKEAETYAAKAALDKIAESGAGES